LLVEQALPLLFQHRARLLDLPELYLEVGVGQHAFSVGPDQPLALIVILGQALLKTGKFPVHALVPF
jgi:hypothetical protein